jgi:hypothetical protein
VAGKPQAQARPRAEKAKTGLNDKAYLIEEDGKVVDEPVLVLMDHDHAQELVEAKSLVVGAANQRWPGSPLSGFTTDALIEYAKTNDISDKVVIEIGSDQALVVDNKDKQIDPGAMQLDRGQYIALNEPKGPAHVGAHKGPLSITTQGKAVELPRIRAGAYDKYDAALYLGDDDDYPNINKADETWDEDEHKRDPRSGRFTALVQVQHAPLSTEIDPRIARAQRRKRRARRATATGAVSVRAAVAQEEAAVSRERLTARRERLQQARDPRQRTRLQAKPTSAVEPQPVEPPKRAPGRLVYGGTGAGGRIVSQEAYAAMQAAKEEQVSRRTPSRQLKVRPKEEPEVTPVKLRMVETEALGAQPRFIYDEYGTLTNLAEVRAYAQAKRAHGSRKPSS